MRLATGRSVYPPVAIALVCKGCVDSPYIEPTNAEEMMLTPLGIDVLNLWYVILAKRQGLPPQQADRLIREWYTSLWRAA